MFESYRERLREQQRNPAQRRYVRRFLPLMVSYVVLLMAVMAYLRDHHPVGAPLILLSALPALPLLGTIGVIALYIAEEKDEFIRHRLVTAMLGGVGILLAVTTVWGFLELNEAVPHFPTFLTYPFFVGAFGLTQCALNLRDRLSGDRS